MLSDSTRKLLEEEKQLESKAFVKLLQERSAALEEELMAIRSCQNGHALPNLLPIEILEKILMEYVKKIHCDWKVDEKLVWVRVTQVCRHWREVALGCAPLWSTLVVTHPEFMNLMLARSKGVPMKLIFQTEVLKRLKFTKAWDRCEALMEVLAQIERFHTVSLYEESGCIISIEHLLSRAAGRAPLLEVLDISNADFRSSFPPDFLQAGTPALRSLSLHRMYIPWDRIPTSSTLTRLVLKEGGPRPPRKAFYESLSNLGLLQELVLENWLPNRDEVNPLPTPAALILRSLRILELADGIDNLTELFDAIRAPIIIDTKVSMTDHYPQGPNVDQCLDKLRTTVDGSMKTYQDRFRVSIQDFEAGDLTSCGKPTVSIYFEPPKAKVGIDDAGPYDPLAGPCITISFKHHTVPVTEVLTSANNRFSLSSAFAVGVIKSTLVPPELFLRLFSRSPNLERLTFFDTPIYPIFHAMKEDPALLSKRKSNRALRLKPYFPALDYISLHYISFEDGGAVQMQDMIAVITFALNKRPNAHFVGRLHLESCKNLDQVNFDTFCHWLSPSIYLTCDEGYDWSNEEAP